MATRSEEAHGGASDRPPPEAPPQRRPPKKKNDYSENNKLILEEEAPLAWRESASPAVRPRSSGLAPSSFHAASTSRRRVRPGQEAVQALHEKVQQSLWQQEKKQWHEELEARRLAFRKVTTLQTFPLQERALICYRQLLAQHLQQEYVVDEEKDPSPAHSQETTSIPADNDRPTQSTHGEATTYSSSSSTSSSSTYSVGHEPMEPKRPVVDWPISPSQSRPVEWLQKEFLAEQALRRPVAPDLLGPPLWGMEPRVFSLEKSTSGRRKYLVAHLGRFMDYYWRHCDRRQRHFYELIPEKTPCRLYLDLEYSKAANPHLSQPESTTEALLDELFSELAHEMSIRYQIQNLQRSHVVDLDSSTEIKFSRHWIVHVPGGSLFAHNGAAGAFVQQWVGRLASEQAAGLLQTRRPLLHQYLLVNSTAPPQEKQEEKVGGAPRQQTCLIDLGVYSRNRLFRLMGSSKFGKPPAAALRIATANQFPFPPDFGNHCFYVPAMEQQQVRDNKEPHQDEIKEMLNPDQQEERKRQFARTMDWTSHAQAVADTLVVPVNSSKIDYPILPFDEKKNGAGPSPKSWAAKCRSGTGPRAPTSLSYGTSPYPEVDRFVLEVLALRGGVPGTIRAWSVDLDQDGQPRQITYQMIQNRWCECIGRAHKSNNIMWTVDFQTYTCWQGCHDPDCRARHFRGTPLDLPPDIRESLREYLFEQALAELDEGRLLLQRSTKPVQVAEKEPIDEVDAEFERALAELNLDELQPPPSRTVPPIPEQVRILKKGVPTRVDSEDESDDEDLVEFARQLEQERQQKVVSQSPAEAD